jgi:hypothetical protein
MEDEEEGEIKINAVSDKIWRDTKGNFHRLNGPAFVHKNGDCSWYRHGQLHRDDGPAVEWPSDGTEEWYKDGKPYKPSAHELMVWKMKKTKSQ